VLFAVEAVYRVLIDVFARFDRSVQRLIDPIVGQLLLRVMPDPLPTQLVLAIAEVAIRGLVVEAVEGREGLCGGTVAAILHDITQFGDTFVEIKVIVVNRVVVGVGVGCVR